MSTGSDGWKEFTPLLFAISCPGDGLLPLIKWMCETGVMTETIFNNCDMREHSDTSALQAARNSSRFDVVKELERWQSLPEETKYDLTQKRFPDLLPPRQVLVLTLHTTLAEVNEHVEIDYCTASGEVQFRSKVNVHDPYDLIWEGLANKLRIGHSQQLRLVLGDRVLPSPRTCAHMTIGNVLDM